jgi:hypothetical protein
MHMGSALSKEVHHLKFIKLGLKAALYGNIKYLFHVAETDVHILRHAGWQARERRVIA